MNALKEADKSQASSTLVVLKVSGKKTKEILHSRHRTNHSFQGKN